MAENNYVDTNVGRSKPQPENFSLQYYQAAWLLDRVEYTLHERKHTHIFWGPRCCRCRSPGSTGTIMYEDVVDKYCKGGQWLVMLGIVRLRSLLPGGDANLNMPRE